jgi:hypothetical protein
MNIWFGPKGSTLGSLNQYVYFNWADATPTQYKRWLIASTPTEGYITGYADDGTTGNIKIDARGNSYFNAGNVGIGTTSPANKLHVNENIGC